MLWGIILKKIDDVIDALVGYYDDGIELDKSTAEQACLYLELLHDLINTCSAYITHYEWLNK